MESNKKKIKILTNIENIDSKASLKNINGGTTFQNLKQLSQILIFNQKDQVGLFYKGREIDINTEDVTIDELFTEIDDITIEIKLKKSQNITNSPSKTNKNEDHLNSNIFFSPCEIHKNEFSKYYCEICKSSICFRCSISNKHKNHQIFEKFSYYNKKISILNEKHDTILSSLNKDPHINSLEEISLEHISFINKDFDLIIKNLNSLRDYYIKFYSEFYNKFLTERSNTTKIEFSKIQEAYTSLQNNYNLKKESYHGNLTRIKSLEKEINSFLKYYKEFSDLVTLKNEFNQDYTTNINSIMHKLELIKFEYFQENKLKEYDNFTAQESEEADLINYLRDFTDYYEDYHTIVSLPIPLSKKIISYDFKKKEFSSQILTDRKLNFKFYDFMRYLNYGEYIFTTGGIENEKEFDSCFMCNVKELKVIKTASMKKCRSQHSLIFCGLGDNTMQKKVEQITLAFNLIFAVSGVNNKTIEIYNPLKNTWTNFKPLSRPRCNANVLFVDNNTYMYVFGGSDDNTYLQNSYERIFIGDLLNNYDTYEKNNFENFKFNFEKEEFLNGRDLGKIDFEISLNYSGYGLINLKGKDGKEQFLVLGGFNIENEDSSSDEIRIFTYDQNKKSFSITNSTTDNQINMLPESSCFYNQEFVKVNENIFAQFNATGVLLVYDKRSQEFESLNPTNLL